MSSASSPIKYRAEIDGLRAVAVIPVMLFHAGFTSISGGFVGVDVFFVISGYLITSLILPDIRQGSFSLLSFYDRRFRRILPALFLVCGVTLFVGWHWLLAQPYQELTESVAAAALFSSNFYFWIKSGYFAQAAEITPLLHTWSLAVEEQFYVLFPLSLLIVHRIGRRYVLPALFAVVFVSLGLAEYASRNHPSAGFYLLPTRAWELGVGAIIACAWSRIPCFSRRFADFIAGLGLLGLACSMATFDQSTRHPSLLTLIPVLSTGAIVVTARQDNIVGRALSWKPLVGIGLVSYSAYLWHQPILAFARVYGLTLVDIHTRLVLLLASMALAYLSWRFVEKPCRDRKRFSARAVLAAAGAVSVMMVAVGLLGRANSGFPSRIPPEVRQADEWHKDGNPQSQCSPDTAKPLTEDGIDGCVYGKGSLIRVALLGDSHGHSIGFQLGLALSEHGMGLIEYTSGGCPPVQGVALADRTQCHLYRRLTKEIVEQNPDLSIVVLVARWRIYREGTPYDNGDGGIEFGSPFNVILDGWNGSNENRGNEVGARFRSEVQGLLDRGKKVVVVYPIPEVGWNVPERMAREARFGIAVERPIATKMSVFRERNKQVYQDLDKIGLHERLLRVYPEKVFCDSYVCLAEKDGRPLYNDDDHPNNSLGAKLLATEIVGAMAGKGWIAR